ncbi:MAG: radical SAM protein [Halobacteriales archaeon]
MPRAPSDDGSGDRPRNDDRPDAERGGRRLRADGGHPGGSGPTGGPPAGHPSGSDGPPSGHPGGDPTGESGHPHGDAGESSHPERDYDERPLLVTWEATQACALACDHCRADARPDRHPDELSTARGKDLIDQVAAFGDPAPIFVFSGGDPMERPDLLELIDYASDRLPTAVTPAPTPTLTAEDVHDLADAGARRMALSLDGPTAERHDGFRGEEGSFAAVERAAAAAEEVGLSIQINTTVTGRTAEDLPEIADLVEDMGAAMWEVFFLVPTGRGTELDQLSPERAEEVMEWLYRRSRDAPFRTITVEAPRYRVVAERVADELGDEIRGPVGTTRAGKGFVFVNHLGEVYPSGFLPASAGNVRDVELPEAYRSSEFFRKLRDPDHFTGPCGDCPHRDVCGGSRSRAAATTGDPFGSDQLCLRVKQATEANRP